MKQKVNGATQAYPQKDWLPGQYCGCLVPLLRSRNGWLRKIAENTAPGQWLPASFKVSILNCTQQPLNWREESNFWERWFCVFSFFQPISLVNVLFKKQSNDKMSRTVSLSWHYFLKACTGTALHCCPGLYANTTLSLWSPTVSDANMWLMSRESQSGKSLEPKTSKPVWAAQWDSVFRRRRKCG